MSSNNSSTARPTGAEAIGQLQQLYQERRGEIHTRRKDFKQNLDRTDTEVFAELCFCLLTPQSSAKTCWAAVTRLSEKNLLTKGTPKEIESLISDVRFNDSKARYITEARSLFTREGEIHVKTQLTSAYNPYQLREWLVENVKGLGYKEASHFLRNVGLGEEFAILDRHILRNLNRLGVITEIPVSITKKRYLEIEEKLRRFATEIGIPIADIDLLFWSRETGWIFK